MAFVISLSALGSRLDYYKYGSSVAKLIALDQVRNYVSPFCLGYRKARIEVEVVRGGPRRRWKENVVTGAALTAKSNENND
jgi:hypothetical protein